MKKFLIIGGDSQLAKSFIKKYPKITISFSKKQCDVTNERILKKIFKKYSFHYVLNCAAITDMEYAEKYPLKSVTVNSFGVYLLNKLCLKYKKKLLHVSSDYAIDPVNTYGISKKIGEQFVEKRFHTVRTAFYSKKTYIIDQLLKKKKATCYSNLFFNPISIDRLIEEIFINRDSSGIKNYFSNKKISLCQFTEYVCEAIDLDKKKLIIKTEYKNSQGKLPRKINSYVKSDINVDLKKDLKYFFKKNPYY
ncbi:hypothetical protein A3A93_06405 [Candidatus Roizmanbacteria bacterium RIFCSPLOWO2_01_FULL_38_12]|uniref:RmlD-like substrate binding domain-containing protein n=2 Tax=Candidatus Roizmaniibacteriota TaxID=1752723 RepID=A0A1F7HIV8_9BACT|nr:MAG: hypothetical protein A3F29_03335 [Candidatus Roizmanbacteria bacterium RIFCSPHIGHO2_12_FULL_33_9]OGK46860.1 MAG: hypothetical protein A3A93_06405 [Candidatus Roizmanbacteria bacterium RIFCSPLOWO2_01_FULL_38_12]